MEAGSGPQLFERSEFGRDPAEREHRRLPAAKRRDAASRGRLSLLTFFGEAKKVSRPPGRHPASENKQALPHQSSLTAKTTSLPAAERPANHAVTVPATTTAPQSTNSLVQGTNKSIVQ